MRSLPHCAFLILFRFDVSRLGSFLLSFPLVLGHGFAMIWMVLGPGFAMICHDLP